jgi:hypothetical protein
MMLDVEINLKKAFAISRKLRLSCKKAKINLCRTWLEAITNGGREDEEEEREGEGQ